MRRAILFVCLLTGCGAPQEIVDLWERYEQDVRIVQENEGELRRALVQALTESERLRHEAALRSRLLAEADGEGRVPLEKVKAILEDHERAKARGAAERASHEEASERVGRQWDSLGRDREVIRRYLSRKGLAPKDFERVARIAGGGQRGGDPVRQLPGPLQGGGGAATAHGYVPDLGALPDHRPVTSVLRPGVTADGRGIRDPIKEDRR